MGGGRRGRGGRGKGRGGRRERERDRGREGGREGGRCAIVVYYNIADNCNQETFLYRIRGTCYT